MEITKKINVRIERRNKNYVCLDIPTLQMLMGTTSVVGNYEYYGVKKIKGEFIVPEKIILKQIDRMKHRRDQLEAKMDIMNQIMGLK